MSAPNGSNAARPLVSIGITTYDRPGLLRECVDSVLAQDFADFEVLIGNDDPQAPVVLADLGTADPRIKILNHPSNLGEVANMNRLLEVATGKYFTWLADDDALLPNFLSSAVGILEEDSDLQCIYPSYRSGEKFDEKEALATVAARQMTGEQFLLEFMQDKLKMHGCAGVFRTAYIRGIGGMKKLGSGFGPYSDTRLAILSSALERLVYLETPTYFYRTHEGSISWSSPDIASYSSAQRDLYGVYRERTRGMKRRLYLFFRILRLFMLHLWDVGGRSGLSYAKRSIAIGQLLLFVLAAPWIAGKKP